MAYKSKYYDPLKAHEYYMKHRKLKGRKKKTSIADLSETGKIAAKEVKEQLQAELKAALKKVKRGNTAERKRLRELYQQKYEAELDEIRKDPTMIKAPKQKKEKQSKQANQKSGGGSSRSGKSAKDSGGTKSGGSSSTSTTTQAKEEPKQPQTETERVTTMISQVKEKMAKMTPEQKTKAKELITKLIDYYKQLALKG